MDQSDLVNWAPTARGWLELDVPCGGLSQLIQPVAQTADHTQDLNLTVGRKLNLRASSV